MLSFSVVPQLSVEFKQSTCGWWNECAHPLWATCASSLHPVLRCVLKGGQHQEQKSWPKHSSQSGRLCFQSCWGSLSGIWELDVVIFISLYPNFLLWGSETREWDRLGSKSQGSKEGRPPLTKNCFLLLGYPSRMASDSSVAWQEIKPPPFRCQYWACLMGPWNEAAVSLGAAIVQGLPRAPIHLPSSCASSTPCGTSASPCTPKQGNRFLWAHSSCWGQPSSSLPTCRSSQPSLLRLPAQPTCSFSSGVTWLVASLMFFSLSL